MAIFKQSKPFLKTISLSGLVVFGAHLRAQPASTGLCEQTPDVVRATAETLDAAKTVLKAYADASAGPGGFPSAAIRDEFISEARKIAEAEGLVLFTEEEIRAQQAAGPRKSPIRPNSYGPGAQTYNILPIGLRAADPLVQQAAVEEVEDEATQAARMLELQMRSKEVLKSIMEKYTEIKTAKVPGYAEKSQAFLEKQGAMLEKCKSSISTVFKYILGRAETATDPIQSIVDDLTAIRARISAKGAAGASNEEIWSDTLVFEIVANNIGQFLSQNKVDPSAIIPLIVGIEAESAKKVGIEGLTDALKAATPPGFGLGVAKPANSAPKAAEPQQRSRLTPEPRETAPAGPKPFMV